jgi:hypothetical protein
MSTKKKKRTTNKKNRKPSRYGSVGGDARGDDPVTALSPLVQQLPQLFSLSLASMTTARCYHGSSPQNFSPSHDHWKACAIYSTVINDDCNQDGVTGGSASVSKHGIADLTKFQADHRKILEDQQFGRFLISWCTELYLTQKEDTIPEVVRQLLLQMGLDIKYLDFKSRRGSRSHHQNMVLSDNIQQRMKYDRDINTDERGIINCLARETRDFCDCMKSRKSEAKEMDKVGRCAGCNDLFPKETLRLCNGCQAAHFHSKDCLIKHWPTHKAFCKILRKATATN